MNSYQSRIKRAKAEQWKELHITFPSWNEIPDEIFEIDSLKILGITGGLGGTKTNIVHISSKIKKLKNLETLNLAKNRIVSLPKELFELDLLEELYLDNNELVEIPNEIQNLKKLKKLSLTNNNIAEINKNILNLKLLQTLDFDYNKIFEIPDEIFKLKNLRRLSIGNNRILKVTKNISKLPLLEVLNLNNNTIAEIPISLGQINSLSKINIRENKIENIPIEIISRGYESVINYLKTIVEEKEIVKLYEAKLIIVGEGGVGKTWASAKRKNRKMKTLLLSIIAILFFQCNNGQKKYNNSKVYNCIEITNEKADSLEGIGQIEKSLQMRFDSMNKCVKGLSLNEFKFTSINDNLISLKNLGSPSIIKISASWCKPCIAEIPAINKIAEEFEEELKVIILFWDNKESVLKMKNDYSSKIELIPSVTESKENRRLEISGFEHYLGFPASYYLNDSKEIMYLSRGAVTEREKTENREAISEKEANEKNYENIKKIVLSLIK